MIAGKLKPQVADYAPPPIDPSRGMVVLVRDQPPERAGTIYLPRIEQIPGWERMSPEEQDDAIAGMKLPTARVMAVGEATESTGGHRIEPPCRAGDRVLTSGFGSFAEYDDPETGASYEVIPFSLIVGVLTDAGRREAEETVTEEPGREPL